MVKIPDRFLGFSFSVGDILIEVNKDFKILNADGAISEIGLKQDQLSKLSFIDLLDDNEKEQFKIISSPLKASNRIGPIRFRVGTPNHSKKNFAIFIGKLPDDNERLFLVLTSSYRLGALTDSPLGHKKAMIKKENFLEKVESILTENLEQEKKLYLTLLETVNKINPDAENVHELENLINKYSTGGNTAGKLNDGRFAFVHSKEPDGMPTDKLIYELINSTGIDLKSTTIDANENFLSDQDGVRALIFSLQQFADNNDGFDIETLSEGFGEIVESTAHKVQHLRTILAKGDFTLVYQPIVTLNDRKVHHSEALIRFNDPQLHNRQFETICFAEEIGLIQDFDKATFNRAVEKINQIKKNDTPPKIAVNMSGRSLSNQAFLDELKTRLKDHIHLKEYIALEITESAEITNLDALSKVISEVRGMGFKIYLDDFGAGAAGFRYLRELVVDGVKIDGDYVRDALVNTKTRTFLRSIVMLCNDLGIETIAEWVETEEQAEFLKSLGVTYAQGYLFGRPNAGIKVQSTLVE